MSKDIFELFEVERFELSKPNVITSDEEIIAPWNKGLVGVQKSKYKGDTNRFSEKQKKLISEKTKISMSLMDKDSWKQKCIESNGFHAGKFWINKDGKNKRINPSLLEEMLSLGWSKGRLIPENKIKEMIANRKSFRDKKTGRFIKGE